MSNRLWFEFILHDTHFLIQKNIFLLNIFESLDNVAVQQEQGLLKSIQDKNSVA